MDEDSVRAAIANALKEPVGPFQPDEAMNPDSYWVKVRVANKISHQDGREAHKRVCSRLAETLFLQPELKRIHGLAITLATGNYGGFYLQDVAEWLLANSLSRGIDQSVAHLQDFLASPGNDVLGIVALSGIFPDQRIKITPSIDLIPIGDLPPSHMKDGVLGVSPHKNCFINPKAVATAALVERASVSPRFVPVEMPDFRGDLKDLLRAERREEVVIEGSPDVGKLLAIAKCLTLFGRSSPFPLQEWRQFAESVPKIALAEGGGGWMDEIAPGHFPRCQQVREDAEVAETVGKYLALPAAAKQALDVPLARYGLSIRRRDENDRAIELGIALEALLLTDLTKDDPISFRIRQRGAVLLAGDFEERKANADILGTVYDLRSAAVHTGRVPTIAKNGRGACKGRPTSEILDLGSETVVKLMKAIIRLGGVPDWKRLELGGN